MLRKEAANDERGDENGDEEGGGGHDDGSTALVLMDRRIFLLVETARYLHFNI